MRSFRADRFADFISCLQSAGYKIKFVLYVRNQADYLPRIYLTVVRFGLETAFNDVLIEVLDHAEIRFQEGVFGFDYVDLLNRLHAFPDVEVIVRSYDRIPASVCSDFLSIFGLGLSDVGLGDEVIANVSLPVESYLQYFVRNRFGRDLSAAEQEAIRLIAMRADRLRMSPHAAQKVKRRFYDSNRKLANKCGIPEFGIFRSTESTHAAPREFCIDEVVPQHRKTPAATTGHLRREPPRSGNPCNLILKDSSCSQTRFDHFPIVCHDIQRSIGISLDLGIGDVDEASNGIIVAICKHARRGVESRHDG